MSINGLKVHSSDLRVMGKGVIDVLSKLPPKAAEELRYNWPFWARPSQLAPASLENGKPWTVWAIIAGRGSGKTRSGSEWCREQVKLGKRHIMAVAATNSDIERVMVKGESGFLAVCWKGDKTYKGELMGFPDWSPTKRTVTWANGAKVTFFSAEEPERLRGPQGDAAWCDELCTWYKDRDAWDMLRFCLRLGKHPQICVTTTPKPTKLLIEILNNQTTVKVSGSSYDNSDNLAPSYVEFLRKEVEGSRLGRQEIFAEILDEASGALWSRDTLQKAEFNTDMDKLDFCNGLSRIVVSVDPAITSNKDSDMTGIVVAGVDVNGVCYVLEDATDRYTPEGWGSKAVELYTKYSADRIVAERNQGGEMVRHTFKTIDEAVPVRLVHASRGKYARAEPVSSLYERGRVKHFPGLDKLEDQMVKWEPLGSVGSPDRLDALVWAITDLALKGVAYSNLTMIYEDSKTILKPNLMF